jgi:hypothetical protein
MSNVKILKSFLLDKFSGSEIRVSGAVVARRIYRVFVAFWLSITFCGKRKPPSNLSSRAFDGNRATSSAFKPARRKNIYKFLIFR